jgi:hypothetical protein
MDQVQVDRQAIQRSKAVMAIADNRLRAPVRDPPAAGSCHATLRHDPRVPLSATAPNPAGEQPLVVTELGLAAPVRVCGVEHGHTRLGGGRDRLESKLLVSALVGRHAHAPESDAELRRVKPCRTTQGT